MKYILLLITASLLTGCSNSINECKKKGYKGFIASTTDTNPLIYCSNGKTSPNKKYFMTSDGEKGKELYEYLEFK